MISILIVDDERIERSGIALLIKRLQLPMEADLAENGEVALAKLRKRPFDVLFTDIKMPFMDGLTLAHEARALYPELLVVIFSAYSDFERAQQAIREQVYRYLLKPINIGEFKAVMQSCMDDIEALQANREEQDKAARLLDHYRRQEAVLRSCLSANGNDAEIREQVLQLLDNSAMQAPETDNPAIHKALDIIRSDYSSDLSLEGVARQVCLAPSYFSALFKQQNGISFVKYLNNYRLDIAARMLCESSIRVNEIASTVGLPGESYFISLFKHRFGMTPRNFRLQMRARP